MNRRSIRRFSWTMTLAVVASLLGAWLPAGPVQPLAASAALSGVQRGSAPAAQHSSAKAMAAAAAAPSIGLTPLIAPAGQHVIVDGHNFCAAPCSPITVRVDGHAVASGVRVGADGTFRAGFIVLEFPGLYTVTAAQVAADGTTRTASLRLNVPAVDYAATTSRPVAAPRRTARRIASVPGDASTQFQPNIAWGGRGVAVDVSPANAGVAIVASESGGLFETTDGGVTWSHIDSLPAFRMSDVKFATNDGQIIIATSLGTTRLSDGGGIWRSTDGGATWQNVAPPPTGPGCSTRYNAWGISALPGNGDVFVGTDCGVAVSHTWGADWTHVVPDPSTGAVWAVVADSVLSSGVESHRGW